MRSHIVILAAAVLLPLVGCVVVHDSPAARPAPSPPPKPYDPLPVAQGWQRVYSTLDPTIIADYKQYISKLSQGQQRRLDSGGISFFRNTNGQHAVSFNTEGVFLCWISSWNHALLYDANHKRIKVLKHKNGTGLNIEM